MYFQCRACKIKVTMKQREALSKYQFSESLMGNPKP